MNRINNEVNISPELIAYLQACGIPDKEIHKSNLSTRLYQDLGIYGDEAIACMNSLVEMYDVDLSGFHFDTYFPDEFPGKTKYYKILNWLLPWGKLGTKKECEYEPITLERKRGR